MLDLVEELLDQIERPAEIWAEADCFFAISLGPDVCPRALVTGKRPETQGLAAAEAWAMNVTTLAYRPPASATIDLLPYLMP